MLDLADALDIAVIEDGAYQALRYDGEAVAPILALEIARKGDIEKCRTIYCGTFSKDAVARTARRLGLRCDGHHLAAGDPDPGGRTAQRHHQPGGDECGGAGGVRRAGGESAERLWRAPRPHAGGAANVKCRKGVRWTKPEGGMFIWLTLPDGMDGAALLAQSLASARVAFVPRRPRSSPTAPVRTTIRLSFSCAPEAMIDEGVKRLGDLIRRAAG